uniref:testis-specific gene A8 protein-like n=1 Tax=Myodes glareolus TaxID=447135 RepID=UPI0020200BF6|nr:testis-specific gene A8 protein-like [Myodes glareolus]
MDLPSSTSDVPMVANGSILMVKTKAAYKQYPPSILYGMGLRTRKHRKRVQKKIITEKDDEEAAAPETKKVKESPVTEMPQPLEEQLEKQAEEQATGEASEAAAADDGESQ